MKARNAAQYHQKCIVAASNYYYREHRRFDFRDCFFRIATGHGLVHEAPLSALAGAFCCLLLRKRARAPFLLPINSKMYV